MTDQDRAWRLSVTALLLGLYVYQFDPNALAFGIWAGIWGIVSFAALITAEGAAR